MIEVMWKQCYHLVTTKEEIKIKKKEGDTVEENKYAAAFDLIVKAGNAKSAAMMAIEAAKEFDFEEADRNLKEAENEMRNAHQAQMDMLQQEAAGNPVDVNIILVHAQDHLSMAITAKELAEQFIDLYKTIAELKKQI